MQVVIVGGSLAGLMQGVMLKHNGYSVHILEQSERDLEAEASGISLNAEVDKFLALHDRIRAPLSLNTHGVRTVNFDGEAVETIPEPQETTSWDALYYRLRANFDGYPSEYCIDPPPPHPNDGEAIYNAGKRVVSITCSGTTATVQYEDVFDGKEHLITADLVIGADGPNSIVRSILSPSRSVRKYAGYVIWRGVIPERELAPTTLELLDNWLSLCPLEESKELIAIYQIPGSKGTLTAGNREINICWYSHAPASSLTDLMTDTDGKVHQWSVPIGKVRSEVWQQQLERGADTLNDICKELIHKVDKPFLQAVSDDHTSRAVFHDGHVLLVGDALTTMRPHSGAGISQGALQALLLEKALFGTEGDHIMNMRDWEEAVLEFNRVQRLRNISWGQYYMGGWLGWLPAVTAYHSTEQWFKLRSHFTSWFHNVGKTKP